MDKFIFGNPQRGIAQSPHIGIADIRNVDIYSEPGVAKISEKLTQRTEAVQSKTFTADASTDQITLSGALLLNSSSYEGRAVTLSTTGTLPAGLSPSTVYYLVSISSSVFKLATSYANAIVPTTIDITDAGTGTHTLTTIEMGVPQDAATDPRTGYTFVLDNNGRVWTDRGAANFWRLIYGNTLTGTLGCGIEVAYNFLFVFRGTALDVCNISTTAKIDDPVGQSSWSNSWHSTASMTINSPGNSLHRTFLKDGILYFGNGQYVGKIEELTTFDPATGSTYSADDGALTLPSQFTASIISELGDNLMVGASQVNTGLSKVFPWDTESDAYSKPFPVPGSSIRDMKNILNILYIASGEDGCIYSSVGTVANLFVQIPGHITGIPAQSNPYARVHSLEYFRKKIYFGLDCVGASGVWSVDITTRRLALEHQISSGSYGTSSGVSIPLLHTPNSTYLYVGWQDADASTQGLDDIGSTKTPFYYLSYGAYIIFELVSCGDTINPNTFRQFYLQLAQVLASSEGVRLSYRTDESASFTTIGTYDYSTLGAVLGHHDVANILNAQVVQIKAELTGSSTTTPKFKYVRLIE